MTAVFLILLTTTGILSRLIPHLPNFTALGALSLFSGAYIKNRWAGFLPLLMMFASDLIISGYYGPTMFYVYGSFLVIFFLGRLCLTGNKTPLSLLATTLTGSIIFYLVTNLGVFIHTNLYPKGWTGMVECYLAALPFLRNTVLGDLFYTAVTFGLYEAYQKTKRPLHLTSKAHEDLHQNR